MMELEEYLYENKQISEFCQSSYQHFYLENENQRKYSQQQIQIENFSLSEQAIDEEQEDQKNITSQQMKKIYQNSKERKYLKLANVVPYQIKNEQEMKLKFGLSITKEGCLKFAYQTGNIIFGQQQAQSVNFKKNINVIEINLASYQNTNLISLEQAIEVLRHSNFKLFKEIKEGLYQYEVFQNYINSCISQIQIDKQLLNWLDEEKMKFVQSCDEYMNSYSQQNEGHMFQYAIGVLNFEKKDIECLKVGYSNAFLDLIGIDLQNFSQMMLRNQQIDLVQDKEELMIQSIKSLFSNYCSQNQKSFSSFYINTFDGFTIKLNQVKKFTKPNYKTKNVSSFLYEYIFYIIEFDVDIEDLKNLIQFRQRLLKNTNSYSFDDFIRKELSFLFESVEYSVYSQQFIEKYYFKNIQNLRLIEKQKQIKKSKQCGIKYLRKNLSKNIYA
ncbi:hypothetical protein TTHERM_00285380 (macronuclear) [Tetrahymena thermophila SB210]|uniref:Uncharacterized protein n=1 Tax=Tetrahymena thermophila (strain SB210) TaxID=312017 RepID=I7M217_TETTS|nr:hypothetical protein TTHERM_00285380 [Tetrahymena thermophila SB210]EAR98307.1 hypothetical protein TTHERM_00285380 [Tetrahymena thermophila SB210]|eukprot:XP_001018552.1 hypothetical protein TTHERM_00285380 [Tetrahymena thermophila SB210]